MTVTVESGVMVASYKRTIQTKQYETATAELFISQPADENPDNWASQANEAFGLVKSVVLDQLGLDYEISEGIIKETGVAPRVITPAQATANVGQVFDTTSTVAAPSASGGADRPPHSVPQNRDESQAQPKAEKDANVAWGKARFQTHPDEFYDNRGNKKNPNGPDLKHKSTGLGLWL